MHNAGLISTLKFSPMAERHHEVDGADVALENVLLYRILSDRADEFCQLCPFLDLMLDHRLIVLFFHDSFTLLLDFDIHKEYKT
jgi:hypothetical protein